MKMLSSPSVLFFLFFVISPTVISSNHDIDGLKNYHQLQLPEVAGPESLAFDCNGKGPYAGVSDGRILLWQGQQLGWTEFATTAPNRPRKLCDGSTNTNLEPTCGRPLGLKFHSVTCDLYIADAYFGLMVVGPSGGPAQQLVSSAEGIPLRFTNALDIDPRTGIVYFTDSSIFFQRRQYFMSIVGGDKTGRLLKYDPKSKQATVLYRGLAFPNGVALSKDYSFLLLAESTPFRILKFRLQDETANYITPELFAQLPRFPDNIRRNKNGEFWVAMNTARGKIQGKQSVSTIPWCTGDPVGVKFDEWGNVARVIDGNGGNALVSVSEIQEHAGNLYMGSSVQPYVSVMKA